MSRLPLRNVWAESGVLLATGAVVYLADRLTKAWVVANVDIGEQIPVIGDVLQIWHTENEGAAFGLLPGGGIVFLVVGFVTLIAIGWVHFTGRVRGAAAAVLLGMILGGTLGNLTDRLIDGSVTDWVSVGIGSIRWPTFNVADSSVVVGILGLILLLSIHDRRTATNTA
ncbi:MAG TPA: signal peptidase II [Candidatus Limnocylindria bacterium]|jgi:signal peptidase II|nr:signal peptidase II [Candidatus Limnocylindria bacterium]